MTRPGFSSIGLAPASSGPGRWPPIKQRARRIISRAARMALRWRARAYSPAQESIALVIAPHPDDEALGCGGLIAQKRLAGRPVHVAYVTDGSKSHFGHPTCTPEAMAQIRETEARQAMRLLGVESSALIFLRARDGALAHLDAAAAAELTEKIAAALRRIRPDEVFLPCRRDGSSEHDAAFGLVAKALAETKMKARVFEFPVWSWWNPLLLVRPLVTSRSVWRMHFRGGEEIKKQALAIYASQVQPLPPWTQPMLSGEFVSFFSSSEEFFFEV